MEKSNYISHKESIYTKHTPLEKFLERVIHSSGSFGQVVTATNILTGVVRAIKLIKKSSINPNLENEVMAEFNLLKKLDHPNVLRVYEAFEDNVYIYIVTELLSGGELFERVLHEGQINENRTSDIIRQTLTALSYCHSNMLAHRDIKPQNILLESKEGETFVKLIDFGLAKFYTKDTYFNEAIGTPLFMAPEILKQLPYDYKVDIWSIGIITFMMLTGKMPFPTKNAQILFASICNSRVNINSFKGMEYLSKESIDFIIICLKTNPDDRWTADKLLSHPWITMSKNQDIPKEISEDIQLNLKIFNAKYKLEQAVYTYLAVNAASIDDEIAIREMFVCMDLTKDGKISKAEFIDNMEKSTKVQYTRAAMDDIFEEIDSDDSGMIDYTEFLRAALNKERLLSNSNIDTAFRYFDTDGNGILTKEELLAVFIKGNANLNDKMLSLIHI